MQINLWSFTTPAVIYQYCDVSMQYFLALYGVLFKKKCKRAVERDNVLKRNNDIETKLNDNFMTMISMNRINLDFQRAGILVVLSD